MKNKMDTIRNVAFENKRTNNIIQTWLFIARVRKISLSLFSVYTQTQERNPFIPRNALTKWAYWAHAQGPERSGSRKEVRACVWADCQSNNVLFETSEIRHKTLKSPKTTTLPLLVISCYFQQPSLLKKKKKKKSSYAAELQLWLCFDMLSNLPVHLYLRFMQLTWN